MRLLVYAGRAGDRGEAQTSPPRDAMAVACCCVCLVPPRAWRERARGAAQCVPRQQLEPSLRLTPNAHWRRI